MAICIDHRDQDMRKQQAMTYRHVIVAACLWGGAAVDAATPGRTQDTSSRRDEAKGVRLSEFDVRK